MKEGCVHIYTGEGKGKTTAATGLAARAAGQGLKVAFFQFMKSGLSGEVVSLAKLGVQVFSPQGGSKFVFQMNEEEKAAYAEVQQQTLQRAAGLCAGFDLVVLDEILGAVATGMVPRAALLQLLQQRPAGTELVLTGRGADEELIGLSDYCTEMRPLAHPYDKGKSARKGIEF